MKRLIYLAGAAALLASCSGTKDYDAYEATLTEMQAQIDTISSAASYGAFLDELSTLAADFASKDVKLNDTQRDRLSTLSLESARNSLPATTQSPPPRPKCPTPSVLPPTSSPTPSADGDGSNIFRKVVFQQHFINNVEASLCNV